MLINIYYDNFEYNIYTFRDIYYPVLGVSCGPIKVWIKGWCSTVMELFATFMYKQLIGYNI